MGRGYEGGMIVHGQFTTSFSKKIERIIGDVYKEFHETYPSIIMQATVKNRKRILERRKRLSPTLVVDAIVIELQQLEKRIKRLEKRRKK